MPLCSAPEKDLDASVTLTSNGAEIIEAARQAAQQKARAVVAGGGDGTINAVASILVGSNVALGVLPMGTLNHFAKDLNIPLELEAAAQDTVAGHSIQIDVGEVNGRIFLQLESGSLSHHGDPPPKAAATVGTAQVARLCLVSLTMLRRYPFMSVRLSTNGQELIRRTPFVFIGNNEYHMDGFNSAFAAVRRRKLSLYVAHRTSRLGLLRLALHALFGRLLKRRVSIRCARKQSRSRPVASVCTSPSTAK